MTLTQQHSVRQVILLSIILYYYILKRTRGFQFNFIAERDVGTLDVHWFLLAIDLDGHAEKKLQSTIPDIVWAQHKSFYSWRASEDKVFLVISIIRLAGKRP